MLQQVRLCNKPEKLSAFLPEYQDETVLLQERLHKQIPEDLDPEYYELKNMHQELYLITDRELVLTIGANTWSSSKPPVFI